MESSCDHSNLMERCEPVSSKACNTGDHRSTPPATKWVLMNLKHWHECDFTWFLMMSSAGQRNWLERNWKLGVIHFCCRILLLSIFCCSETWALSALFLQSSHLPSWVSIVSTVTFDDSCPAIWSSTSSFNGDKKNCTSWSLFCSCCSTHHDMGLFISPPPWAPAGNLQHYYLNPIA